MGLMKKASPFVVWLCGEINRRDVSVRKLAERSGLKHATVSRWLLGEAEPDARNVDILAAYFGVDRAFIYGLLGRVDRTTVAEITEDEADFIRIYRSLNRTERARLLRALDAIRDEPAPEAQQDAGPLDGRRSSKRH